MKIYNSTKNFSLSSLVLALCLSTAVQAQESANAELDACTTSEQIATTAKGAGLGMLAGLGSALFSNNKDAALKNAAIGAVVGGAAGFATGYYNAIDICYKKNPSWIPESQIERTQDYAEVKKAINYKSSQGIKFKAEKLQMPAKASAKEKLDAISTFYVMTPDGAEVPVTISRTLFAIVNGAETLLPFNGKNTEQRMIQAGRHQDTVHLPIPEKAQAGTQYRLEFSISVDGKPASIAKATVTIQ